MITTTATGTIGQIHVYVPTPVGTTTPYPYGNIRVALYQQQNTRGYVVPQYKLITVSQRVTATAGAWNIVPLPIFVMPAGVYMLAVEGDRSVTIGMLNDTTDYFFLPFRLWKDFPNYPPVKTYTPGEFAVYADWYHY